MLQNVLNDIQLYRRFIAIQIRAQAQYKVNLTIDIGTYLAVTSLEFTALFIFFGSFHSLLGWQIGEVALLYALTGICFGLAEMVGAGIDEFSETIRRGEFDRVLLRPVGVFTQVIGSNFRLRRLGRITQGCLGIVVALHFLPGLHWSALKVAVLLLGLFSGATIFVAIMLLGATLCFWTIETTELINILTYGAREFLGYPITIYHQVFQSFFLFVVPLAFGTYLPTCFLLDRAFPFGLPQMLVFAAPVMALAFTLVAASLWRVGVRRYQSTGS
ncbi:MAG: ABC-2 family transporter protein [Ktedonobacteraceae bacterium]